MGSGSPVIKNRSDLSPPDPARRSRPDLAGAVTPAVTARHGGAWERRLRLGLSAGAGGLGLGFCLFEVWGFFF